MRYDGYMNKEHDYHLETLIDLDSYMTAIGEGENKGFLSKTGVPLTRDMLNISGSHPQKPHNFFNLF